MQHVQYNKTCINLKRILRIDWKIVHKLILSISIEQCHKSSIAKSRNGPLTEASFIESHGHEVYYMANLCLDKNGHQSNFRHKLYRVCVLGQQVCSLT